MTKLGYPEEVLDFEYDHEVREIGVTGKANPSFQHISTVLLLAMGQRSDH